MSLGRHAEFMEGEEEGAPAPGDPRHCDGCLQVFPEVWPPPICGRVGGVGESSAGSDSSKRRGEGRVGRHGGCPAALGCIQLAHLKCARDTASCLWPARDYFRK